jgi:hypothetical protein
MPTAFAHKQRAVAVGLNQPVIIGVAADPIPDNSISIHNSQGAVSEADSRGVNVVFAFQLLELQSRMSLL